MEKVNQFEADKKIIASFETKIKELQEQVEGNVLRISKLTVACEVEKASIFSIEVTLYIYVSRHGNQINCFSLRGPCTVFLEFLVHYCLFYIIIFTVELMSYFIYMMYDS